MTYDFDKPVNRRNSGSLKWEVEERELPMWVADMDFRTAPEITEAIKERAEHGVFGYSVLPGEWYEAYTGWWRRRYGLNIEKDWLMFCTGVIPAVSSIIRRLTKEGENVVIQTPVYNNFFNSILNNRRKVLENPLKYDGENYSVDFEDLEEKLKDPNTTLMILCNPHNPIGKIWDRDTLSRIGGLCSRWGVTVLSDEIHCDLTDPGRSYIPFASVSEECLENSVTCIAPTKTFNIAGIQTAAVFASEPKLRGKIGRGLDIDGISEPGVFAVTAAASAYTRGENWLDALREYLYRNKQTVREFLADELPHIRLTPSDATYLLWLNCSAVTGDTGPFCRFLRKETGLFVTKGGLYGGNGKKFLRMNIACPEAVLLDGLNRLKAGTEAYLK